MASGTPRPHHGAWLDPDGISGDALVWYGPGPSPDHLWNAVPPTATRALSIGGDYLPVVGDFDGDGRDDIAWYGPGGQPDHVWWGRASGGFAGTPLRTT